VKAGGIGALMPDPTIKRCSGPIDFPPVAPPGGGPLAPPKSASGGWHALLRQSMNVV